MLRFPCLPSPHAPLCAVSPGHLPPGGVAEWLLHCDALTRTLVETPAAAAAARMRVASAAAVALVPKPSRVQQHQQSAVWGFPGAADAVAAIAAASNGVSSEIGASDTVAVAGFLSDQPLPATALRWRHRLCHCPRPRHSADRPCGCVVAAPAVLLQPSAQLAPRALWLTEADAAEHGVFALMLAHANANARAAEAAGTEAEAEAEAEDPEASVIVAALAAADALLNGDCDNGENGNSSSAASAAVDAAAAAAAAAAATIAPAPVYSLRRPQLIVAATGPSLLTVTAVADLVPTVTHTGPTVTAPTVTTVTASAVIDLAATATLAEDAAAWYRCCALAADWHDAHRLAVLVAWLPVSANDHSLSQSQCQSQSHSQAAAAAAAAQRGGAAAAARRDLVVLQVTAIGAEHWQLATAAGPAAAGLRVAGLRPPRSASSRDDSDDGDAGNQCDGAKLRAGRGAVATVRPAMTAAAAADGSEDEESAALSRATVAAVDGGALMVAAAAVSGASLLALRPERQLACVWHGNPAAGLAVRRAASAGADTDTEQQQHQQESGGADVTGLKVFTTAL